MIKIKIVKNKEIIFESKCYPTYSSEKIIDWNDLSNADLEGADLRYADLRNADLEGAILRNAYLEGAEEIDDFNLMYNVECSSGIHFFRTRGEAEKYEL